MTQATITTLDGSTISSTISGITAHVWTADATGLFTTTADLGAEWAADYAAMQAGQGAGLTPLQRVEANAQAVILNTGASRLSATALAGLRQDAQREFDAVDAAMTLNKTQYGTDPAAQFNIDTYLQMEETLQGSEALKTLALQGHGLNSPPSTVYDGFTTDFQNHTDGKTFYVGGGLDGGKLAIASFFDDVVLTHAAYPTVLHNGVLTQLNQNGNIEGTLADAVTAANEMTFTRVLVAADFSANSAAAGPLVLVPNPAPIPALPVPAVPLQGTTALDGTLLPEVVSGLTLHTWTADSTGLYGTLTDLGAEWRADYAAMLAGQAGRLTPLQRMEGNAEAVFENTGATKLSTTAQAAFRADAQREYDAIDAAMRIDQGLYGIDPNAAFTDATYRQMQQTLQGNEVLRELGYQGHGVNQPPAAKYAGFTTDFQNRTDGATYFVGGGPGSGELAISGFFDDDVLTHAPFPVVWSNGVAVQLNQNGNQEAPVVTDALVAADEFAYGRVLVAADFSTDATASGPVVAVTAGTGPAYAIQPLAASRAAGPSGTTPLTFLVTRTGSGVPGTLGYAVTTGAGIPVPAGLFANPTGTVSFGANDTSQVVTLNAYAAPLTQGEGFTVTLSGPAGTAVTTAQAQGTIGANAFMVHDTTSGASSAVQGTAYQGPVAGLQWQFMSVTPDNVNVTATAPNAFIHTGGGNDAIDVSASGGTNVLDGGTGSNFLVGGTGPGSQDTFFVDDRGPSADIWTTVANMHAGDSATVFGLTAGTAGTGWYDNQGATGYTGLTLHAVQAGRPTASLTLAGFSQADLASGRLSASYGSEADGTAYLFVHCNT